MKLTQARLKELFSYSPETGVFIRTANVSNVKIGMVAGNKDSKGHLNFCVDGTSYSAHRMAWLYVHGEWPRGQIDHINGVRTDNRIENLRDVNASVNAQNLKRARRDNKTGLLGVSVRPNGTFIAQIQVDGRVKHLGVFSAPEAAHQAYLMAKRGLHAGCTI